MSTAEMESLPFPEEYRSELKVKRHQEVQKSESMGILLTTIQKYRLDSEDKSIRSNKKPWA